MNLRDSHIDLRKLTVARLVAIATKAHLENRKLEFPAEDITDLADDEQVAHAFRKYFQHEVNNPDFTIFVIAYVEVMAEIFHLAADYAKNRGANLTLLAPIPSGAFVASALAIASGFATGPIIMAAAAAFALFGLHAGRNSFAKSEIENNSRERKMRLLAENLRYDLQAVKISDC